MKSTACYLILSDGYRTALFEKDLKTATTTVSSTFIVATNHDVSTETPADTTEPQAQLHDVSGMMDFIDESVERKECLEKRYNEAVHSFKKLNPWAEHEEDIALNPSTVETWMESYPTLNECTHYAVVMDPVEGDITWVKRWKKPYKSDKRRELDDKYHGFD
jgi:hypothetical protein